MIESPVPSPYEELLGCKVVILVEEESCTDRFLQLMLNERQFKAMTKYVSALLPQYKDGFIITLNDDREITLREIKSWYSPEEIAKMQTEDE